VQRTAGSLRARLNRVWGYLLALRLREAFGLIGSIEQALSEMDGSVTAAIRTEIAASRALGFALRDDCVAALPAALLCLNAGADAPVAFVAATLCRVAYWKLGDFGRYHAVRREQPVWKERRAGLLCFDKAVEAAVEMQQLRFGVASRLAREALALVTRSSPRAWPPALLPSAVLAQLFYEQGALRDAEAQVRDCLPLINARGTPETSVRVYPLLARIAAHRTRGDLAWYLLGEGEALGERRGWPRLVAACLQERVELLVRAGKMQEAQSSLERVQLLAATADRGHYVGAAVHRFSALASARVGLPRESSFAVVTTLRHLHQEALTSGDLYGAVQLAICLAESLGALGEEAGALETLTRSLELGASVGIYQSFVDGGPVIGRLLDTLSGRLDAENLAPEQARRRFLQPYVGSVLSGWRRAQEPRGTLFRPKMNGPLSSRECGILSLIRRGYSNKQVALELGIAPETVKSHAKHIFVKLGAQTRVEAVFRAVSLGLI
jgi:ATP/maltotriose-dependent transcriptional regulator MalT